MTTRNFALLAALVLTAASCQTRKADPVEAATPSPASSQPPAQDPPQAVLERMDDRVPVPLLPMMANHQKASMRDHLLAVQEMVQALAKDDLAGVGKAAKRIGYSREMGAMCTHMGAGAPGFTDQALKFHRTADQIALSAQRRDRRGVLLALGATLQACTACHATFRQSVVDASTWNRLTNQAVPAGHGSHGM
jgi:hypothetical protein